MIGTQLTTKIVARAIALNRWASNRSTCRDHQLHLLRAHHAGKYFSLTASAKSLIYSKDCYLLFRVRLDTLRTT
jgi:hypothetical protein